MTEPHTSIGIDISKEFLDCYALPLGQSRRFANSSTGIKTCLGWIGKLFCVERIILEPTGGYERPVLKALQLAQFPVARINAFCSQHFRKAKNDQAKTDKMDAIALAQYGIAFQPDITPALSAVVEDLKEIVHRRRSLKKDRAAELTRQDKSVHAWSLKSIERHIAFLDQEIKDVEREIKQLLIHPDLKAKADLLMANKGISFIIAATLLAEMPELGQLDRGQVARLLGVAPMSKDSGKSFGHRHIRGGRKSTRNAWYLATMVAVRFNPPLKNFFLKLKNQGKPYKVALTAAMRKFIIWVNAQIACHINGKLPFLRA